MNKDRINSYTPDTKMRRLLLDNSMLLPAISRFNISFGFGDDTVAQACRNSGVDTTTFLCVCNLLSGYDYDDSTISLQSLTEYLKRAHVSFLDITLPKIRYHLIEAINYNDSNEVALLLIKFYDEYVMEVRRHMEYENDVIFTYVDRLLAGIADENFNIAEYSESHRDTVEKLNELKDIFIYHYKQHDNGRLSSTLLDIIICERDMLSHFEVESSLLVPAVKRLENKIKKAAVADDTSTQKECDGHSGSLSLLSEREKDIIRCVARGKVNKEIADLLCISIHTVATHRRNISAKLDIHTTAGLTVFAIINHLVELNEVTLS